MKTKKPSFWYILIFVLNAGVILFATASYFLSFNHDTILPVALLLVMILRGIWIQGQCTVFEGTKGNEKYNSWFSVLSVGFIGVVIGGVCIYLISPNDLYHVEFRHYAITSLIIGITAVAMVLILITDLKRPRVIANYN